MNRKILSAVIMTSRIVSAFAGCGSTDYSDSTETSAAETSAAETEASSDDFGVWTALAGDNGTTYPNLFKVILSDDDYSYRYDYSAAVVGEDNAKSTVDYLRSFISADIYGDEAVAAYADADSFLFDCWYLNDVDTFTFKDDTATLENVISLFCLENMDYSAERTEADLAQISDFVGTWDADLSGYGDDYADTELYTVIGEDGRGETYMNGEKSADYNAYAYDNDEKGDGKGIYVAYSNLTKELVNNQKVKHKEEMSR